MRAPLTPEHRAAVRRRLADLEDANGRLTPDDVVADAQNPDSPLHELFQWDDAKAAHQHRLDQARQLITTIRVVTKTSKSVVQTVAYVRDPDVPSRKQGYRSVVSLRHDEVAAREAVCAEFARAAAIMRRARELALALGLDGDVDQVLTSIDQLRRRADPGEAGATLQ